MNISKIAQNLKIQLFSNKSNLRYNKRQYEDICKYGLSLKTNVPSKILNEIAPYRRKSNKGTALSDPDWFIINFELKQGKDYLPSDWNNLTQEQKSKIIVTERYTSLLARNIMNKIKNKPEEHRFDIFKGTIVGYTKGNNSKVKCGSIIYDTTIHNHPVGIAIKQIKTDYVRTFLENLCPDLYTSKCGFSGQDIFSAVVSGAKSYVIDSNNNRFLFEPKTNRGDKEILTAMKVKNAFEKIDLESQEQQMKAFGKILGDMMKKSGKTSEKNINNATDFYDKYGSLLTRPILGKIRNNLFHSEEFKNKLLDKIGKYTEF